MCKRLTPLCLPQTKLKTQVVCIAQFAYTCAHSPICWAQTHSALSWPHPLSLRRSSPCSHGWLRGSDRCSVTERTDGRSPTTDHKLTAQQGLQQRTLPECLQWPRGRPGEGSAETWAALHFVFGGDSSSGRVPGLSSFQYWHGGPDSSKRPALKLGLRAYACQTQKGGGRAGESQSWHGAPRELPLLRPACLGKGPQKTLSILSYLKSVYYLSSYTGTGGGKRRREC